MEDKQRLIGSLTRWVTAGKLDSRLVLPAIAQLAGGSARPQSLLDILSLLEAEYDPTLAALAGSIRDTLLKEALRLHEARKQPQSTPGLDPALLGVPLEVAPKWRLAGDPTPAVNAVQQRARELGFVEANRDKAPRLLREVKNSLSQSLATAYSAIAPRIDLPSRAFLERVENALPANLPGRDAVLEWLSARFRVLRQPWLEQARRVLKNLPQTAGAEPDDASLLAEVETRFLASGSRDEQAQLLDWVCAWPTPAVVSTIGKITVETWARDRAVVNLALRFGESGLNRWEDWMRWLSGQNRLWLAEEQPLSALTENHPQDLLLILYSHVPDQDATIFEALVKAVAEGAEPITAEQFVASWSKTLSFSERNLLLGLPVPPVIAPHVPTTPVPSSPPAPPPIPPPLLTPVIQPAPEPAPPPRPSIWTQHIQPLFVENWYIVAGIAMVILGSSLLAYYTWDKHWLVRYTIMPLLLAFFTWTLARAGRWIEKKSDEFKGTAAILRGAAIGLLPINFMATALLSADEKVPQKGTALLVMALLYLSVFGWSLRSWCAAIEPSLKNLLSGALLFLNALVAVGPLARTVGHLEGQPLLVWLGAGFYLGFAVTAGTIVWFSRRILTPEMAGEKRVPWFVAGTLALTYVQVFVWVHGFMRHLPQAQTYSLLVIATGWLVLYSERRALQIKETPLVHGGESFLGFALILLGLLMGFTEPTIRILSFLAAGGVWLHQALSRARREGAPQPGDTTQALHYWIALTLLGLGGAAIGLLSKFPGVWLPALGVALALAYGLVGWFSEKRRNLELAQAGLGMQVVALVVTVMVSTLAQWHYQSKPLATAAWLLLVAALFAWRALRDQKIHWLHGTMLVMALVLPYAGCLDMGARTAHHNTLPFGLAILSCVWLILLRIQPRPLLLQARSTVLWFYGVLAVAAMLLRVVLGDTAPDPLWYRDYMDYCGPILMMLVLAPATYHSRSLVPAGMAVAIMAILFPELKGNLQESFPWLAWGSGFASSVCGLALVLLSFYLRQWPFLKNLPEGDLFMGKERFPLRRYDHTLFTLPVLAAALFLIIKVDTWNLVMNQLGHGVQIKTAIALVLTGVAWTLFAVYQRKRSGAVLGVHLGWFWALVGITYFYWREASEPHWSWPFLITALLLQVLYWVYRFGLQPGRPWVWSLLSYPMRQVLLAGSGALTFLCIACLVNGAPLAPMQWLYLFLAIQLVWHSLRTRHLIFGTIFFFQIWTAVLVMTAPGSDPLWIRVSVERSLTPTLLLFGGLQLVLVGFEFTVRGPVDAQSPAAGSPAGAPGLGFQRLLPLLVPALAIVSVVIVFMGMGGIVDGVDGMTLSRQQQGILLVTLLLTARAQASNFILLTAMLLGYVMIHGEVLAVLTNLDDRIRLLLSPWHLGLLALAMILLAQLGCRLVRRKARLLVGPFAQKFYTAPSPAWIVSPALVMGVVATLYQTLDPALRESTIQLLAPYLGALSFALVAWFWGKARLLAGAGILLTLGNVHLVRVFGGDTLRTNGLSELHLICLGLGFTLLQASLLRRWRPAARAVAAINLWSLGLAGLVLALLSANYFTAPDLLGITPARFIVSGALAWLAGMYFRRSARHPGPGEEAHIPLCEALYHFGIVLALWCAALLIPVFRQPFLTLIALGLPALYFYLRAEFGLRAGLEYARRYRNSAAVLGFTVLGLYLFKGIFHLVLFPGTPISTQYYHFNAPLIMLMGVMLLRLHGLGGTSWLAFYGGLALMTGSYFLLTWLPGLSPFNYPMPSAWCAIGLGHFWILVSYARSPVRSVIQRIARLDEASWASRRRSWGWCLLAATQGVTLLGIFDYETNTKMVAPLLAAAATIIVHQGVIKRSAVYYVAAAVELALALHMDFFPVPSYLTKENVIWAILVIWLALLVAYQVLKTRQRVPVVQNPGEAPPRHIALVPPEVVGRVALFLAAMVFAHVLYHRPWTTAALWATALAGVLAAWNPQRTRQGVDMVERLCAALLLWIPVWLVYFSQAPLEKNGVEGAFLAWPILATTLTIFLIGVFARLFPTRFAPPYLALRRSQFRLFDVTLDWMLAAGAAIHQVTLWITLITVGITQAANYNVAFAQREIVVLALLEASLAVAWFYEGKRRQSMLAYYLMQISALACCVSIRRHLMLTTTFWNYEYDVWTSLAFTFALAGAKQVFDLQPRALRVPLLTSMVILPVVAFVWVVVHGLGVNMALLVIGLNSVVYAYLGKEDRESPYNIVALGGFVTFIIVTFYFKLQLRAVHAYIIPTGLGVLVLQELFRRRINPDARNWIRLVTLMAMLGSSGYYALADPSHPITFNLTMVILSLLAMGLGSFLQIRLYLALGFAGLMVDLVSILYKVLVAMERSARMTIIGSLVLVIGAILVFGAIYYKTNKAGIDATVTFWRRKLGQWE